MIYRIFLLKLYLSRYLKDNNCLLGKQVRKIILSTLIMISSSQAADSIASWFEEGSVKGNIRYYYIETKKDLGGGNKTSAHANSIGGQLHYETGDLYGFRSGVTFMTTNGFALPNAVDTSIIGRDNGVRLGTGAGGEDAQDSFSVLGEAYVAYSYKDLDLAYGRRILDTPLIHEKDVRMLPSAVQGAFVSYGLSDNTQFGISYLTHFKQRTSDRFVNIVQHALGDNTQAITGDTKGDVLLLDVDYKLGGFGAKAYNYYVDDFMNALYLESSFKNKLDSGLTYHAAVQYINQMSIGTADKNLGNDAALAGGKIDVNAFALKTGVKMGESGVDLAVSKVLSSSNKHDSLVLPWDGTPLFTNMITSNDLFQSNYGKALGADSIYIGGSRGVKVAYTQGYDFLGLEGVKTVLSYLNVDNDKFEDNQRDYNAVIAYGKGDFSLALKGIWVRYNSSSNSVGTVSQIAKLNQYRVIANYKF